MDIETRIDIIKEVGEEIITEEDLRTLLQTKAHPIAYDGFEPSGNIHIAQGMLRAINIQKMLSAGCKFKLWVADWFALMNNKMGGDLEKIRITGEYFIEVWKACGLDTEKVEFLWANDVMSDTNYWKTVVDIGRLNTVKRITRCSQIMGREESDSLSAAQIFYPCMQCTDIFHLKADIAQLGMDQRKVNMLAREVGPKLGLWKPVAVHHHMLMGLGKPASAAESTIDRTIALKMSKSKPDTAIFMTDSTEDIKRKISKAYCMEKEVKENPILEYAKYIVFEKVKSIKVERPEKYGGNLEFYNYAELEHSFREGLLHPMDLKAAVAREVDNILDPVRQHFEKNAHAKKLKEQVQSFHITR